MSEPVLLTVDTVAGYLSREPELAAGLDVEGGLSVLEVGDGNLNLVFLIEDAAGRRVVLKQSLPHVRTDPSWPMTRERTAREVRILREHGRVDAEHVPALYGFDARNYVVAMEDLRDHNVWRRELIAGRVHPYAAEALGRYVAKVGFATSVFGLRGPDKRRLVAATVNPELSEITEDLVFTEPYVEHPHNVVLAANEADVAALREDGSLLREIGLAKIRFQDDAQSLLHGDLHTGSVLVRESDESVRAFDAEFGAFGPTGFDLGAVWANLVIAAARAEALGERTRAAVILGLPEQLWSAFEAEYRALWPARIDPRVFGNEVLEGTIARIRSDAAVFAGAKAIRRVVGFAKAADIESLDEDRREVAARAVLRAGRSLAVGRLDDDAPGNLTAHVAEILTTARP